MKVVKVYGECIVCDDEKVTEWPHLLAKNVEYGLEMYELTIPRIIDGIDVLTAEVTGTIAVRERRYTTTAYLDSDTAEAVRFWLPIHPKVFEEGTHYADWNVTIVSADREKKAELKSRPNASYIVPARRAAQR